MQVGIITKVDKDMPEELLRVLSEAGVDTAGMKVGQSGTSNLLIYDEQGNKRLEFLSKAPVFESGDIPAAYLEAGTFFICPIDYEVPKGFVQQLSGANRRLVVDLGGYGGAASASLLTREEKLAFLKEIIPLFEVVKASREDCLRILGTDPPAERELLSSLIDWGAGLAILTQGAEGVLLMTQHTEVRVPAFPCQAVDTTGAGDVWCAAFLARYAGAGDPVYAARFACAATSLFIEGTNGVSLDRMPTREQVERKIA
jgi:sugar/nucleoside kinase (ribokinase family)